MGLQAAVIEYARNVLKLEDARSAEMTKPEHSQNLVIDYKHDEHYNEEMGASMRLGSYVTSLMEGSLVKEIYNTDTVTERHRHRLEINNKYRNALESAGMVSSHRWFIATQFCPEFQSKPFNPHPLYNAFIQAAYKYKQDKNNLSGD